MASSANQYLLQRAFYCKSCYHEEERGAHGAEELGSVGGDRVDSTAPGQRVEPRLADHIQVGGDVHGSVLTATQVRKDTIQYHKLCSVKRRSQGCIYNMLHHNVSMLVVGKM